MPRKSALALKYLLNSRAFFLAAASCCFLGSCTSGCNKEAKSTFSDASNNSQSDEQCQMPFGSKLRDFYPPKCQTPLKANEHPKILAGFKNQSSTKNFDLDSILNQKEQSYSCPTEQGPFLLSSAVDIQSSSWQLELSPNYFACFSPWPAEKSSFYLTDSSGFPIKSEIISYDNGDESLALLFLTEPLQRNKQYFLYIQKLENNAQAQKWIQPLALTAEH